LHQGFVHNYDLTLSRQAKKQRWELSDEIRRKQESELYRYLSSLMEREKNKQLDQLADGNAEFKEEIVFQHKARLADLDSLMKKAGDAGQKREVPDFMMSKVRLSL
jgi:hypothetical protein